MVVDRHVPKDQNHHASGLIWSGLGQGEFDYINRILLLKHMLQMIFFPPGGSEHKRGSSVPFYARMCCNQDWLCAHVQTLSQWVTGEPETLY
jgi:hypothetical protein